eukprot:1021028_1
MATQTEITRYVNCSMKDRIKFMGDGELEKWEDDPMMSSHLKPHYTGVKVTRTKHILPLGACRKCDKVYKLKVQKNSYTTSTMINHAREAHKVKFESDKKKKKAKANSINGCGYSMYQKDDLKQA